MTERDPNLVKYEKYAIRAIFGLFAAFVVLSLLIGGDAFNGHTKDGVYYVSSRGTVTAVSAMTYYLSIVLGSLALGGMVLLVPYKIVTNLIRRDQN